jgi:DNA modification methylase
MEELVRVGSYEGETILEPFAGSGTTLVAAKRNARNFCGFEMRSEFIPVIQERLDGGTAEDISPVSREKAKNNPKARRVEGPSLF